MKPNKRDFKSLAINLLNYGRFNQKRNDTYEMDNKERNNVVLEYIVMFLFMGKCLRLLFLNDYYGTSNSDNRGTNSL